MVPAMYDWSGFYIGLNGGDGWNDKFDPTNAGNGLIDAVRDGCHDATGATVRGQIACRWQA
jgi:outer membrane immunogenic protein